MFSNAIPTACKPMMESPKLQPHLTKQQQFACCWCLPIAVSSILLILLLGTASLITNQEANTLRFFDDHVVTMTNEAPLCSGISDTTSTTRDWINAVLKPVLIEVGALVIFQSVGMPFAKFVMTSHKGLPWIRLFSNRFLRHRGGFRLRSPRTIRRVLDSAKRIYRRRSRLSAASDFTHVIGDEPVNETKAMEDIAP